MRKHELIKADGGFNGPFVYLDEAGKIRVGNKHISTTFQTLDAALEYASRALLSGDELLRARTHHEAGANDRYACAYEWHIDALFQIDAIKQLSQFAEAITG